MGNSRVFGGRKRSARAGTMGKRKPRIRKELQNAPPNVERPRHDRDVSEKQVGTDRSGHALAV